MKKLFVLTFTLFLCFGLYGQTEDTTIHFKELIGWMKYGFAGQNLDAYKAFAQGKGLEQLYEEDKTTEVIFAWGKGIEYGCVENKEIEETDLEYNWKDVKGLKYNENSKVLTSWRFIYFYHIGELYFASFQ